MNTSDVLMMYPASAVEQCGVFLGVVRTEPTRVEPVPRAEPSPFAPAPEPVVKADPVQKIGS